MKRKRLTILRDFLRRYRPRVARYFDMGDWGLPDEKGAHCGTAACALGWATTIPELYAAGLRLTLSGPCLLRRDDEMVEGFSAAAQLFDIDYEQAEYVFGCLQPDRPLYGRPGMLAAADRIDDVLEGRI